MLMKRVLLFCLLAALCAACAYDFDTDDKQFPPEVTCAAVAACVEDAGAQLNSCGKDYDCIYEKTQSGALDCFRVVNKDDPYYDATSGKDKLYIFLDECIGQLNVPAKPEIAKELSACIDPADDSHDVDLLLYICYIE